MASGQSQVSSETIEKTKQQIRGLVGEIAQLSKSDMPAEEFYSAFLQRVVQALAAVGGAVWVLGEGKKPQLKYQINLSETLQDQESDDAEQHSRLLEYILASKTPQLVPPLSRASDERMGGNPTRNLLVVHPLGADDEIEGLIEILQRPDTQPSTQRGYLQFLKQMCELAAEWFKNRKLRDFSDKHSLWAQADQFSRAVHESLEVRETCYTIVNEGRRLLGCDRVSIGILRGGKCVIDAVSGQDLLDNRSNVVTLLGNLATKVIKSGEPLWYTGATEDLPPQIEESIEEYVDQSYTKSLAVIPLRQPKPVDDGKASQIGAEDEKAHQGKIVGALIIEQIESEIPREILAPRLDMVYEHSARAISNSLEHNSLFLMPVWRALGKSKWVVQGRQLPKTVMIGVGTLVVLLALLIPWEFDMRAKGALEPVVRREIFAPIAGEVDQMFVDNGDDVTIGQPLLKLRNPDLAVRLKQVEGELNAAIEELNSIRARLTDSSLKISPQEKSRDEGQFARVQVQVSSLREQLALLRKREEQLTVKSPIAGRVITWDARRMLQNRPVETGQVLLTVAAKDSDYEVELFMPERRARHLAEQREKVKRDNPNADLEVDFILMTDPGRTRTGKIKEVMDATEPHEEQGNIVRVRITPDEPITSGRPGATVTADVHCGRAPLGWGLLHEAWEWLEANVFF
ncbi:MAG: HlyD family efflux transporter periplasmic adaptor subunit [Pirellulaceae bacterium]|nr:HlyD family efflux transporter periplasmic adaptor subunit [Pirellulaceae bacterium]